MKHTRKIPLICFIATAVLTLLCIVLRTLCLFLCWDAEVGYFDFGVLPFLMNLTYPLAIGTAAVCAILLPKDGLSSTLTVRGRSILVLPIAAVLISSTVVSFLMRPAHEESLSTLVTATALLALPAAAYFILSARREGRYPDWLVILGFTPILWSMAAIAETYVDLFVAMNSPVKISLHMGLVGVMLILVTELRFRLSKAAPRLALALFSIGTFLCLSSSMPLIITLGRGILTNPRHFAYAAALLFMGVYGGASLFSLVFPRPSDAASEDDAPIAQD